MDVNILSIPTSLDEIRKAVTLCDTPELLLKIINELDRQMMDGVIVFTEQEDFEIFVIISERTKELTE